MKILDTQTWVLECPLMIEDKASDKRVTLEFCKECSYHVKYENNNVECNIEPLVGE